ncbi:radical SAM superfamily enzyme with C-terminal helix-hairpin-helix motif [Staphylococcus hominis]|nr:radical SAM superfamily enzyme with C-terminal helix-hairpin-helix motif [Staphylococcus hominis]
MFDLKYIGVCSFCKEVDMMPTKKNKKKDILDKVKEILNKK